ncbi:MAG: hypothetical protein AB7R89_29945 [Dehalococcoidia bacterium]
MATLFCGECGHRFRVGAQFCGGCGTPVPHDQAQQEPVPAARTPASFINPKVIGAVLAALFIIFTFLGSDTRREAMIRFIDRNLYEPVAAISPLNTIPEFYHRVYRSCHLTDALLHDCPSNNPVVMLFRVPGAIVGTTGYVLSQGPVAVVVVGIPVLILAAIVVAGVTEDPNPGVILNPMSWMFLWLVSFPLFTGVFAWGIQLVILVLLLMLKSLIAALAFMGIFYFVFEKLKLWEEMRKLFERVMTRISGKKAQRQAG